MMLCFKNYQLAFSLLVFSLFCYFISAQELPPLQVFSPQDYAAGDQNWSIGQGEDKIIYVANNKGLLEYNGARWKLYETPNGTILRSVEVIGDKIYTGSYMDFGFWERNKYGLLSYTSLIESSQLDLIEDEEFWEIISVENWVLFQSFDRIYIYNSLENSFRTVNSKVRINKIYDVNGTVYFQKMNDGIYKIENGKEILLTQSAEVKNEEVVNIFQNEGLLLIQTKEKGFYTFNDGNFDRWKISASDVINNISVYSSIKLRDGSFLFGTISNGIIQLNSVGDIILRINQKSGLSNNTVLSAFEDNSGNIWLGLDNGINALNLDSPYKVYKDNQGVLGTIYASIKSNGYLYIGTNQGLFYRKDNFNDQFELVERTKGQVWSLMDVEGTIFCGHDKGTFVINRDYAQLISDVKGTWVIKPILGESSLFLQGNYKGLSILERKANGEWIYRNKITGFDISSRYIEFIKDNEILVSHEYKGVYRLKFDSDYTKVIEYEKGKIDKGINSSLVNYNGKILYVYSGGVFEYNKTKDVFNKNSALSTLFSDKNYISGKLILDKKINRLWGFSKDQIIYVEPGKLTDKPIVTKISLPSQIRKSKAGFENILGLEDNIYFMGTKEGYLIADLNKLKNQTQEIKLNTAFNNSLHKTMVPLEVAKEPTLASKNNNIHFSYSASEFNKFSPSLYQYRLDGIYDEWSPWSSKSDILFENLPSGDYVFEARAKINGNLSTNTISYPFNIEKPWYLSIWAIIFYFILFISGGLFIQFLNTRYYKKQRKELLQRKERELEFKELESQRQIMEFKNENLRQDIDNKNRELGMSTMNLINKNELLNSIKKELSNTDKIEELKSVIKLINKNLNTTDDWKLFEEAFNNADKDFLKKVKTKHSTLTSNDLRLCTYLRLNLSSKEIAPLLNISPRSVEVKRYRLRKKMELPHETGLSNYILDL